MTDVVLIMGASSDIGCALIEQIDRPNQTIVAHYQKSKDRLLSLSQKCSSKVVPFQCDLLNFQDTRNVLRQINSEFGVPACIVHMPAPKLQMRRFPELSWKDYDANLNIQLRSAVEVLTLFLPQMAKLKRGRVVFVLSSVTLGMPPSAMSDYCTAKFALLGLMKSLSTEYAGYGITVNAVSPGMVKTRFLENVPARFVEMVGEANPMKRLTSPIDVAGTIQYFLQSASDYITGVNLPITGGSVS